MLTLVQMHGEPGSGKSTLAAELGRELRAVVMDKDIISSALLSAWLAPGTAGPASYEVIWGLARSFLSQGFSVIVDSPAGWPIIEQRGQGIARATHAAYAMIECICADRDELQRRLSTRDPMLSQPTAIYDWNSRPGAAEPTVERLVLDTHSQPLERLVAAAAEYVRSRGVGSVPFAGGVA